MEALTTAATDAAEPVNLLWTGGWDSTYRLLDLVLNQGLSVQPHYVVRPERNTAPIEMATMEKVKAQIAARSPAARALVLDTLFYDPRAVPDDPEIAATVERLKSSAYIGEQYISLAALARHNRLDALELCVHVDDRLYLHLQHDVVGIGGGRYRLDDRPSRPELAIFTPFIFPILLMTKVDMERAAQRSGFLDILELSWFCFAPDRKGRPCGRCHACGYTMDEGMGRRVPWQGHVRRQAYRIIRPARAVMRRLARRMGGAPARG